MTNESTPQQPSQGEPSLVKVLRDICADPGTTWPWPLDQNEAIEWRDYIDRLTAENAALLKDKERLDHWFRVVNEMYSCPRYETFSGQDAGDESPMNREAIDAALAPTQQERL